jgi:monofunctional biosynthetic peptidoglycan transglycosylase
MTAKRSFFGSLLRFVFASILAFLLVSVGSVLALRWIDPPTTAFMIGDRIGAWLDDEPNYRLRHNWVDWPNIAAPLKLAVVSSEDQTFATHHGFDFKSINDALDDRESGRRVRGASTISQQVAKNLFLWPGKNWVRKGLEAWFTVLIEALWPKQRILEVHLNVAQFGRHLFGVGAAATTFFHKPASKLTADDAALLAAVLPNPVRLRADKPSRYVRNRQQWIMSQMRQLGELKL